MDFKINSQKLGGGLPHLHNVRGPVNKCGHRIPDPLKSVYLSLNGALILMQLFFKYIILGCSGLTKFITGVVVCLVLMYEFMIFCEENKVPVTSLHF